MFDNYANHKDITPEEELAGLGLPDQQSEHPLDASDVRSRLNRIQNWRQHARFIEAENRISQMLDHNLYDGEQWTEEDKQELINRGQIPQVFNRIKPTVDWIVGTEKRTRVDFRVLPRCSDDSQSAEIKTKLLKYIADVNRQLYSRSRAFSDAVISGLGWIEVGIRSDKTGEPMFIKYEDWRNIWYDPFSTERDLADARFIFREKYVDLDVACAMFPDRNVEIQACARAGNTYFEDSDLIADDVDPETPIWDSGSGYGDTFNGTRSRVRLTECWYRMPEKVKVMRGENLGVLDGIVFDAQNQQHQFIVEQGYASLYDAIKMQVRCMIFCEDTVLQDSPSPYRHNRFPFVPIWGYRTKKNNAPYGVVRNLKDPQDDLNKRRSKALFILSTNQIIADNDATDDWDEFMDEASRPDGLMRKKPNSHLEINNQRDLAEEHIMLMSQDAEYIEATGGVTDEQMGRQTNATSGKAIMARQEQGHVVTHELFDNLRFAVQLIGEIEISLIEQYYTEAKVVRITGDRGQLDFVEVNQPNEYGEIENDITERQADFQVDASNFSASVRQATFEALMNLLGQMDSQIALALLDLVVDLSDIPGKDEMVRRIRQVNGQTDPDADPNDPKVQQEMQEKIEQQRRQAEFEEILRQLEIAEKRVSIEKNRADAAATQAGIGFDQEKLSIEKAQTLHDIRSKDDQQAQDNKPYVKSKDGKPGRNEKGLASNNQK